MDPGPHAHPAALLDSISHPDVLARIFQRLPVGDQCFTVSLTSNQWRQWAASRQAEVQAEAQHLEEVNNFLSSLALHHSPLIWVKREWHGLGAFQQQWVMDCGLSSVGVHLVPTAHNTRLSVSVSLVGHVADSCCLPGFVPECAEGNSQRRVNQATYLR